MLVKRRQGLYKNAMIMRMLEEDQRGDGVEYDLEGTKIADFGSLSQSFDD